MKLLFRSFLIISIIGVTVLLYFLEPWRAHPSDENLIEAFKGNRASFEAIVAMIQQDADLKNKPDYLRVRIAQDELGSYRQILTQLNIPVMYVDHSLDVEFAASNLGYAFSGSSKGYSFLKKKPADVVDNLDTFQSKQTSNSGSAYRHIDGNWYLFYESN